MSPYHSFKSNQSPNATSSAKSPYECHIINATLDADVTLVPRVNHPVVTRVTFQLVKMHAKKLINA
jgi:hypothetical protein